MEQQLNTEQLQRTDFWHQQRMYKFTSSCAYKLLSDPKSKADKDAGKLSATAETYILEKIVQEVGGFIPEFENAATKWGEMHENSAKFWYKEKTGNNIEELAFIEYNDYYGGSPDAKVIDSLKNEVGGLEVKCPYISTNHLKHCLIDSAATFKANHPEYYWQCISHMITLNVNFCDFVSFDPRIDSDLGLFIFRLERNEDDVNELLKRLEAANNYKNQLKLKLKII